MYSGAAIDASGNIYYQENLVSNGVTDAGYEGQLAWTTGGVGHLAWHFTQLPAVGGSGSAQDGRYAYTYELPDGRGGIDVIGVSDVSCENSAWAGAYGYTISSADQTGDCYILDRVEDWHTSNLNASGGPTWTMTEIASYTNTTACPLTNGVNIMLSLDDAYRDTDGNIHVLTSPCASAGATDTHYVLSGGSVTTSAPLPVGYCDAPHMRIIQDYSGRFWLFSNCNSNQIYSWHSGLPTTDPYGLSLGPEQTITTTHVLDGYPYLYLAAPRAGLPQNQKYLDLVAPYNNYTGLLHFRIKLDQ
jgi:hypothetical protein